MADRNVKLTIRADAAQAIKETDRLSESVKKVGTEAGKAGQQSRSGLSGMAQHARENADAWTSTGTALLGVGTAMTGLGVLVAKTGISYNSLRQTSMAALTTMLGGARAAADQMDRLDAFASTSPFARDVFIRAQQQLIGFGYEAERVVPILDAIQNAVAAAGGSNHDIAELTRIIAQVGAAGKITAVDLMQFGQRGVDAATLIGSQMGKTGAQIRDEITAGTLDADAAIRALTDGMTERFGGAAAAVKDTFAGAVDRLRAAFRDLSAELMAVFVDPTGGGGWAVDALNYLSDLLRMYQELPDWAKQTTGAIGGVTGVVSLLSGAAMVAVPQMVSFYDALGRMGGAGVAAQAGIRGVRNILSGPWGVAIAGAVTAIGMLIEAKRRERAAIQETIASLDDETGAVTENTRARVVNMLEAEGWLRIANNAGVQHGLLTDAILDETGARERLWAQLRGTADIHSEEAVTIAGVTAERVLQADSALALMAILEDESILVDRSKEAWQAKNAEMKSLNPTMADLLPPHVRLAQALMDVADNAAEQWGGVAAAQSAEAEQAAQDAARAYDILLSSIRALNDEMFAQQNAQVGFYSALDSTTAAIEKNGRSLDVTTEAGRNNRIELMRLASATGDYAAETFNLTGDLSQVESILWQGRDAFIANALAMGATKDEANRYANQLGLIPEDILTRIELSGTDYVLGEAQDTVDTISDMEGIASMSLNSREAQRELDSMMDTVNKAEGISTQLLRSDPAYAEVEKWKAWTRLQTGMAKADASILPGQNAVFGLLGWIGRQWATVNVTARMVGGLNIGGGSRLHVSAQAAGGVTRRPAMAGPGFGQQNVILWGEPETRGEAFISNHPQYRDDNLRYLQVAASWFDKAIVDRRAAGGVSERFAAPAWSQPSAQAGSSGPVVAALAPEDRALLQAVAGRPVSVRVGSREVAYASREGEQSFGAAGQWSGAPRLGRGI